MTKNKDRFIRVYNAFFDNRENQNELKLTNEELYTYILIELSESFYREKIRVMFDSLLFDMNEEATKGNRRKLIETINSLAEKKLIIIHSEQKNFVEATVNHELFNSEDMIDKKRHSFEKLYIDELEELIDKTDGDTEKIMFYLLVKHESRHGAAHFESKRKALLSYSLLSKKLGFGTTKAHKMSNELVEKGVIERKTVRIANDRYESTEYFCAIRKEENVVKVNKTKKAQPKVKVKPATKKPDNTIDMDSLTEEKEEKTTVNVYEEFLKDSAKNKGKSMAEQIADENREEKERSERRRESEIDELYDAYKNNDVDKFNRTARKMTVEEMASAF